MSEVVTAGPLSSWGCLSCHETVRRDRHHNCRALNRPVDKARGGGRGREASRSDDRAAAAAAVKGSGSDDGVKSCPACGKQYKKSHACKQNCHEVDGLTGIVYLVQPSALWVAKSNIFKIGCSKQLTLSRPRSYGPNPAPHALASVDDPSKVERALIAAFDAEFKCESAVGREYYSGHVLAMKRTFHRVVDECLNDNNNKSTRVTTTSTRLPSIKVQPSTVDEPDVKQEGHDDAPTAGERVEASATDIAEETESLTAGKDAGNFMDWLFVELSTLFTAKMKLGEPPRK